MCVNPDIAKVLFKFIFDDYEKEEIEELLYYYFTENTNDVMYLGYLSCKIDEENSCFYESPLKKNSASVNRKRTVPCKRVNRKWPIKKMILT